MLPTVRPASLALGKLPAEAPARPLGAAWKDCVPPNPPLAAPQKWDTAAKVTRNIRDAIDKTKAGCTLDIMPGVYPIDFTGEFAPTPFVLNNDIRIRGKLTNPGDRVIFKAVSAAVPKDAWLANKGFPCMFNSTGGARVELVDIELEFVKDPLWSDRQTWKPYGDKGNGIPLAAQWAAGIQPPKLPELYGMTVDHYPVPLVRRPDYVNYHGRMYLADTIRCENQTIGISHDSTGDLTLTRVKISNFATAIKCSTPVSSTLDGCDISAKHQGILTTSHVPHWLRITDSTFHDIGVGSADYEWGDLYTWSLDHALYLSGWTNTVLVRCKFFNTVKRFKTVQFANDGSPQWSGSGDMIGPASRDPLRKSAGPLPNLNTLIDVIECDFNVPRPATTHPEGLTRFTDCTFHVGTNYGPAIVARGDVKLTGCRFFSVPEINMTLEPDQQMMQGGTVAVANTALTDRPRADWAHVVAEGCTFERFTAAFQLRDPGLGQPDVRLDWTVRQCDFLSLPWPSPPVPEGTAFDVWGGRASYGSAGTPTMGRGRRHGSPTS